jgi:hypothetical protein
MTRYVISAAAVLLLSASPVLAADTMKPSSQPAGANTAGSDTSTGAKEQSSAPPGSPAESDLSSAHQASELRRDHSDARVHRLVQPL